MSDAERRRKRNCDGFTNPKLMTEKIGLVWRCPNAIQGRAMDAFRWWAMWRNERVLPFPGLDFGAQPYFVVQAIREGDAELALHTKRLRPKKDDKRPPLTYPKEIEEALERHRARRRTG